MSSFFYYLTTAADSALSIFGIRAPYEQPGYQVVAHLPDQVEIRAYAARTAVETPMRDGNDGEAFGRLFRYITGANIKMTTPVEQTSTRIAMTIPVEMSGENAMRFFLPREIVQAGPPKPTDPNVHIVALPPADVAAIRFSGTLTDQSRATHTMRLTTALAGSPWHATGTPSLLSYDPPFAIPFLRRNEIIVEVKKP